MKRSLAGFENLAQRLIEGTFARLHPGPLQPSELLTRLIRAMEDGLQPGPRGEQIAPDRYRLYLKPEDLSRLQQAAPELEHELGQQLLRVAQESGFHLAQPPTIQLVPVTESNRPVLQVIADYIPATQLRQTAVLERRPAPEEAAQPPSRQAYVIVEGHRLVPLQQALITIGRQLDNDIVIDDPRISRRHAQLRLRYGYYVIYDLGSHGGTFVNGFKIEEYVLQPGDVISLAGAPVIYNEEYNQEREPPPARPGADTETLPPAEHRSQPRTGPATDGPGS